MEREESEKARDVLGLRLGVRGDGSDRMWADRIGVDVSQSNMGPSCCW
jgi:hypothetical protein